MCARFVILSLLVLLALACASCPTQSGCERDEDCPLGRFCSAIDQNCTFECTFDNECPDAFICSERGRCERGCSPNKPCPLGAWCDEGACQTCDSDTHCGSSCTDCSAQIRNRVCVAGGCACSDVGDCAPADSCLAGICESCAPNCGGRCDGSADGCGGVCDSCVVGSRCTGQGLCEACESAERCGPACAPCQPNAECLEGMEAFFCLCEHEVCGDDCCAALELCQAGRCLAAPRCGNDLQEEGEACDDGNTSDGDECTGDCRFDCTGGRTFRLHCYRVLAAAEWVQGRISCQVAGMDLALIDSAAERDFVLTFKAMWAPDDSLWIGANDRSTEGIWVWGDGTPLVWDDWHPGEPNNAWSGTGEDCAVIHADSLDWHDLLCSVDSFLPLCESL